LIQYYDKKLNGLEQDRSGFDYDNNYGNNDEIVEQLDERIQKTKEERYQKLKEVPQKLKDRSIKSQMYKNKNLLAQYK
jgi:hypothetical protein